MSRKVLVLFFLLTSCSVTANNIVVEKDSPIVQGVALSENIGIETLGGVLTPLLKSGCELLCELSQVFSTAEDNQKQITITLFRGPGKLAKDGVNLGKYKIYGIVPAPRGEPQIEVIFHASDRNIWLSARDKNNVSKIKLVRVE